MPVDLLNAWTGQQDYPTNGHTLAASAGTNRVGIVTVSHEMNGGGGIGNDGGCVVVWGGQTCAEGEMDWCGGQDVYHDMAFIGYLTEAQVALMTDGVVDSVTITNGNGGVGPFGNSKVKTAFYENVDQGNIISAASKANTGNGTSSTATADNLTMGTLDTDVDEQVIMHGTSGQGETGGADSYVDETGWTHEVSHVGDETNDHASSSMTRDSQANDDALAVNFNCASANRLSVVTISLGFAAPAGGLSIPVAMANYRRQHQAWGR